MQKTKKTTNLLAVTVILFGMIFPLFGNVGHAKAADGGVPGYVSNFEVEYQADPDVIHVSWGVPTDTGDSAITGYKIAWSYNQANDYSSPISVSETHYDLSTSDGLAKDRRYDIKVWAVNSDGDGIYDMIPWVLYGVQVYNITTCQELQNINNDPWGDYTLANDIDCSVTDDWTDGFVPIGGTNFDSDGFSGNFDGNGHTITNLYMSPDSPLVSGLFGIVQSNDHHVNISNFNLEGCQIHGGIFSGAVAGTVFGDVTISDIATNCTVVGVNDAVSEGPFMGVGGIAGAVMSGGDYTATITRTSSKGVVVAALAGDGLYNIAGGLVGILLDSSVLSDSYTTAHVIGGDEGNIMLAGGVGVASTFSDGAKPVIKNIYATGEVTLSEGNLPGGLIALVSNADVQNSFASNIISFGSDTLPGFLIGQVTSGSNVILNNFMNAGGTDADVCMGGDITEEYECSIVNTETAPDTSYFIGNNVYEPMASWDFNEVWEVTADGLPVLNYRPVTDDGEGGSSGGSGSTVNSIKKKLTNATALPFTNTPKESQKTEITLNNFDDYFETSGHLLEGLMIGQVIHFDITVNGVVEHHTVTVKDIGEDYVILTIASTPFDVRIKLGELKTIEIDGHKIMNINLISTEGGAASLSFSKYTKPLKTIARSSAQVVPKKNQTNMGAGNIIVGIVAAIMAAMAIIFATRQHRKSLSS